MCTINVLKREPQVFMACLPFIWNYFKLWRFWLHAGKIWLSTLVQLLVPPIILPTKHIFPSKVQLIQQLHAQVLWIEWAIWGNWGMYRSSFFYPFTHEQLLYGNYSFNGRHWPLNYSRNQQFRPMNLYWTINNTPVAHKAWSCWHVFFLPKVQSEFWLLPMALRILNTISCKLTR